MIKIITPYRDGDKTPTYNGYDYECMPCRNNLFAVRNKLLETCEGYKYALCVDDDIRFKDSDVEKLLFHDLDFVSGAYITRQKEGCFCAAKGNMWMSSSANGLHCVDMVGAGFFLIKMESLRKLKKPYFRHVTIGENQTSEDFGFCIMAKQAGFKIYVDCDCKVEHV